MHSTKSGVLVVASFLFVVELMSGPVYLRPALAQIFTHPADPCFNAISFA